MDGTESCVFEKTDHLGLDELVHCLNSTNAIPGIWHVVAGDLFSDPLHRRSWHDAVGRSLILAYLSESFDTWPNLESASVVIEWSEIIRMLVLNGLLTPVDT